MRYNQTLNYQRRQRFLFRVRLFFLFIFIALIGSGCFAYYSVARDQASNTDATTKSQQTSGYFAPSVKVFRSAYFQFQTDETWSEVPTESDQTRFIYKSLRNNLIEHQLTIYVNSIPESLSANRVLPVNFSGSTELKPDQVSEHCTKAVSGSKISMPEVNFNKVKFKCNADSTNYTVLVGAMDGTSSMDMLRPDGTSATYAIHYSNLKASPNSNQITQIIGTFQTR